MPLTTRRYKLDANSTLSIWAHSKLPYVIRHLGGGAGDLEVFGQALPHSEWHAMTPSSAATFFTRMGTLVEVSGPSNPVHERVDVNDGMHCALMNLNSGLNANRDDVFEILMSPWETRRRLISEEGTEKFLSSVCSGGPRVWVLGSQGSGKSTVVQILSRYALRSGWNPRVINLDHRGCGDKLLQILNTTGCIGLINSDGLTNHTYLNLIQAAARSACSASLSSAALNGETDDNRQGDSADIIRSGEDNSSVDILSSRVFLCASWWEKVSDLSSVCFFVGADPSATTLNYVRALLGSIESSALKSLFEKDRSKTEDYEDMVRNILINSSGIIVDGGSLEYIEEICPDFLIVVDDAQLAHTLTLKVPSVVVLNFPRLTGALPPLIHGREGFCRHANLSFTFGAPSGGSTSMTAAFDANVLNFYLQFGLDEQKLSTLCSLAPLSDPIPISLLDHVSLKRSLSTLSSLITVPINVIQFLSPIKDVYPFLDNSPLPNIQSLESSIIAILHNSPKAINHGDSRAVKSTSNITTIRHEDSSTTTESLLLPSVKNIGYITSVNPPRQHAYNSTYTLSILLANPAGSTIMMYEEQAIMTPLPVAIDSRNLLKWMTGPATNYAETNSGSTS